MCVCVLLQMMTGSTKMAVTEVNHTATWLSSVMYLISERCGRLEHTLTQINTHSHTEREHSYTHTHSRTMRERSGTQQTEEEYEGRH